jgi:hypothetical protein
MPFHCAAAVGNLDFFHQALAHLHNPKRFSEMILTRNAPGRSSLDVAALCGQASVLSFLLSESHLFSQNALDAPRAVANAASGGSVACLDLIFDAAAACDSTRPFVFASSFKCAAQYGHIAALTRLCDFVLAHPNCAAPSQGAPAAAEETRTACASATLSALNALTPGDPAFATASVMAQRVLSRLLTLSKAGSLVRDSSWLVDALESCNAALCEYYLSVASDAASLPGVIFLNERDPECRMSDAGPAELLPPPGAEETPGAIAARRLAFKTLRQSMRQTQLAGGIHAAPARSYVSDCAYAALDVVLRTACRCTLQDVRASKPLQVAVFGAFFAAPLLSRAPEPEHERQSSNWTSNAPRGGDNSSCSWFQAALQSASERAAPALTDLLLALIPPNLVERSPSSWSRVLMALMDHSGPVPSLTRAPQHPTLAPEPALYAALSVAASVSADADARARHKADTGRAPSALLLPRDTGIGPMVHHTEEPAADYVRWLRHVRAAAAPRGPLAEEPFMTCFPRFPPLAQSPDAAAAAGAEEAAAFSSAGPAQERAASRARQARFRDYVTALAAGDAPVCPVCLRHTVPITVPFLALPVQPPSAAFAACVLAAATPARCTASGFCESTRLPDDVRAAERVHSILERIPKRDRLKIVTAGYSVYPALYRACRLGWPNLLWVLLRALPPPAGNLHEGLLRCIDDCVLMLDTDIDRAANVGPPVLGARLGRGVVTAKILRTALPASSWRDAFPLHDGLRCGSAVSAALDADCLPQLRFALCETVGASKLGSGGVDAALWHAFLRNTLYFSAGPARSHSTRLSLQTHLTVSTVVAHIMDAVQRTHTGPDPLRLARLLAQPPGSTDVVPSPLTRAVAVYETWPRSVAAMLAFFRAGGSCYCESGGVTVLHRLLIWNNFRREEAFPAWRGSLVALLAAIQEATAARERNEMLLNGTTGEASDVRGVILVSESLGASKKNVLILRPEPTTCTIA